MASPEHERLWFRDAVEGLFIRNLKGAIGLTQANELKRLGLDLERLLPAYPVATFRAALDVVGPLVAPTGTPMEQQIELGRRITRGYFDTLLGRPLAKIMGLVGPDRGITRIGRSYRNLTNYLDARLLEKGIGRARVSFSPVEGLTGFILGINQESGALLANAGQTTKVSVLSDDGVEALMQFEWSAWR